jgi:hypothetical protein
MAQKDDLEAVRAVVAALDGFAADEQERVIRWAREKLKLPVSGSSGFPVGSPAAQHQPAAQPAGILTTTGDPTAKDLRTFVAEKKPNSDVQFAATVAYYHRFEAPEAQRKTEIVADDLGEACRLVNRERLHNPLQTLQNARNLGLLDRPRRGVFAINSVGENLVAMTLPSDGKSITPSKGRSKRTPKKAAKTKSRNKVAKE